MKTNSYRTHPYNFCTLPIKRNENNSQLALDRPKKVTRLEPCWNSLDCIQKHVHMQSQWDLDGHSEYTQMN